MSDPAVLPSEALKAARNRGRALAKALPDTMAGFAQLSKAAKTAPTLTEREKELIALGIAVAVRCEDCILFHIEALHRAGGTRADLADTLGMAVQMGGGPAVMYAGRALELWDGLYA